MNYRIRTILIFERFMNLYRTYSSNSRYTNLKHILLTGTDDSNSKLFKNIQFEKGNPSISKKLRENRILQGLCVPSKYL